MPEWSLHPRATQWRGGEDRLLCGPTPIRPPVQAGQPSCSQTPLPYTCREHQTPQRPRSRQCQENQAWGRLPGSGGQPQGRAHPEHTSTMICRPCGVMFRRRRLVSKSSRACMVSRYRDYKEMRPPVTPVPAAACPLPAVDAG